MIRPWIAIALLGISWLIGLDYYELANPWSQAIAVVVGMFLLSAAERSNPLRGARDDYPELTAATVLLLIPVAYWTPWPYRLSPLVILAGLLLERVPFARRSLRPLAAAGIAGGVILMLQSVALTIYAAATARSHDLPAVAVKVLAGLCRLVGIEAAGDGSTLVVQTARQAHRLAVSGDIFLDPATLMFLVGGLAWITIDAGRRDSIRLRGAEWGRSMARFALIVAAWLPIRAVALVALYLHRAAVSDWRLNEQPFYPKALPGSIVPLDAMNQFLSSWVLLAMLVPPILMAWRWVREQGAGSVEQGKGSRGEREQGRKGDNKAGSPLPLFSLSPFPSYALAAATCCLFGAFLVALGWQWEPVGARKAGRVMIVEKHSPWSTSDFPYDTEHLGGGDGEKGSSYNYAAAYRYLSQFYEMSRLNESDAIDAKTLSGCDVLVIKIPRFRFTPEEVQAVVDFVQAGGGLLFIGDHTNLENSSIHMNDISRAFGFTFRHDVLYSCQPSPDQEHYQAPLTPHPAMAHVPEFDFAVSCSIDPGISAGRPVVEAAGLFSMPPDYDDTNWMGSAMHLPETRFGSFVQAWSTHFGRGRVIAWGDSTIFSNFCFYQPGKSEVLLNLVEWLNHRGGPGVWWLWTLLGLGAIGNGLWLVRQDASAWLVLVAALACGWTIGSTATAALQVREMPMPSPSPDTRLPLVVIDRTLSRAPLAKGPYNEDPNGRGYGLMEQAIPRLGFATTRAEGDDVFRGDAVVIISPSRPATAEFRKRLLDYVDGGGRLMVIDAGLGNVPSTSNQILRPFGIEIDYRAPWLGGELRKPELNPSNDNAIKRAEEMNFPSGIIVPSAWQVFADTSAAITFHAKWGQDPDAPAVYEDPSVCATAQYGKGLVIAVAFGNLFNDQNLGISWMLDPTPADRARYDLFFAVMRRLVSDPIVVPTKIARPAEPGIKVPLDRPVHRGLPPPRRGGT